MKRYFCSLFTIILGVLVLSCKKYLDQPPTTNFSYPTTVANCQALLDNWQVMNEGHTPGFLDGSVDDYFLSPSQFNSTTSINREVYLWGEPKLSLTAANDWTHGYQPVYHANVCLENIDKIEKSGNLPAWNNVKGSALFFRAYYFLYLAWQYSKAYDEVSSNTDLGIALKTTSDLYQPTVRSTVKQTYDQIISDAKLSIQYLPDTANHPLRPSKVAAYGLLARTYLSMRIYDSALAYAHRYLVLKDQLIDYNGDIDLVSSFALDISPFRLYNKETAFYTSASGGFPGKGTAYVDTLLYSSYAADDLRREAFFAGSGMYKGFKGSYTQNDDSRFSGLATDELYLIRAECYARRGEKDNALADLNALLHKRWKAGSFVPITSTNAEQALQVILVERRKELLMRSLRWADIKRLNKEPVQSLSLIRIVNGQSYLLPPNDNRYALPLPQNIVQQTGITQNPR